MVKNLPAMQIQSLSHEDPLEKEMATHSGILAWEILWTEEPGGLQSTVLPRVRHDLATKSPNNLLRDHVKDRSEPSRPERHTAHH